MPRIGYNLRTDDVHIRYTTPRPFHPISPGLSLLRFDFDATGAAGSRESGNALPE
jgi:hypothetical protein